MIRHWGKREIVKVGRVTLLPLLSTQIIRFFSSTTSSPAVTGMIVSGGICASPGPTFVTAFLAVGAGGGIGRASPGRIKLAGGCSVYIVLLIPVEFSMSGNPTFVMRREVFGDCRSQDFPILTKP